MAEPCQDEFPRDQVVYSPVSAAARIFQEPGLTDAENQKKYGAPARLHGDRFVLTLGIRGTVEPASGMLINFYEIERIVENEIRRPFHLNFINEVDPWFMEHIPSAENLAIYFFERLKTFFPAPAQLFSLTVESSDAELGSYELERI